MLRGEVVHAQAMKAYMGYTALLALNHDARWSAEHHAPSTLLSGKRTHYTH
jgi:hypothetical protein